MKKIFVAIGILISVLPFSVSAAELKYFEFSSDISDTLQISSVETPYQAFIPYNDYLSGFDFWIENFGSSGTARFDILTENNAVLISKTIDVPYTGGVWGGKKFHIQLSQQIKVDGYKRYKIGISSVLPQLKLHYVPLVQILEHNAVYSPDKVVGPAVLGLTEQEFAFKFALYENNDVSAPVLSNVSSTPFSQNKIRISFNANEPVDYKISGVTSFFGNYFECYEGVGLCVLDILAPSNATGDYQLAVKDAWGNEIAYSFSVGALISGLSTSSVSNQPGEIAQDTAPPAISDVRVVSLEPNKVKIGWKTNEAANSSLSVELDKPGVHIVTSIGDAAYEMEHVLATDAVLFPSTKYYASVSSIDSSGNAAIARMAFTTPATPPPGQKQSEQQIQQTQTQQPQQNQQIQRSSRLSIDVGGNAGNINIRWLSSAAKPQNGYRVDIFDSGKKLIKQTFAGSDSSQAAIEGLSPGDYYAIVYGNNDGVFEKIVAPADFKIVASQSAAKGNPGFRRFLPLGAGIIAILAAFLILTLKNKFLIGVSSGFTLLEILVSVSILVGLISSIGLLWKYLSETELSFFQNLGVQQEVARTFQEIVLEGRSIGSSSAGSYPIAAAASTSLTFYSDIDADGLYEQVRYFLENGILKKGVLKPSGNPLAYNQTNETIGEAVHDIASDFTGVFSYYASNIIEDATPLGYPINISDIRMIKMELKIKPNNQNSASWFNVYVTPRNIRSL